MGRVKTVEVVIFAEQFKNGTWDVWKHVCSRAEGLAVMDTARLRAKVRSSSGRLIHDDVLEGARGMFNVANGPAINPQDGDKLVYCVCVDKIVIGEFEKIRQYSLKFAQTQETVKVAINDPLYGREATATALFA